MSNTSFLKNPEQKFLRDAFREHLKHIEEVPAPVIKNIQKTQQFSIWDKIRGAFKPSFSTDTEEGQKSSIAYGLMTGTHESLIDVLNETERIHQLQEKFKAGDPSVQPDNLEDIHYSRDPIYQFLKNQFFINQNRAKRGKFLSFLNTVQQGDWTETMLNQAVKYHRLAKVFVENMDQFVDKPWFPEAIVEAAHGSPNFFIKNFSKYEDQEWFVAALKNAVTSWDWDKKKYILSDFEKYQDKEWFKEVLEYGFEKNHHFFEELVNNWKKYQDQEWAEELLLKCIQDPGLLVGENFIKNLHKFQDEEWIEEALTSFFNKSLACSAFIETHTKYLNKDWFPAILLRLLQKYSYKEIKFKTIVRFKNHPLFKEILRSYLNRTSKKISLQTILKYIPEFMNEPFVIEAIVRVNTAKRYKKNINKIIKKFLKTIFKYQDQPWFKELISEFIFKTFRDSYKLSKSCRKDLKKILKLQNETWFQNFLMEMFENHEEVAKNLFFNFIDDFPDAPWVEQMLVNGVDNLPEYLGGDTSKPWYKSVFYRRLAIGRGNYFRPEFLEIAKPVESENIDLYIAEVEKLKSNPYAARDFFENIETYEHKDKEWFEDLVLAAQKVEYGRSGDLNRLFAEKAHYFYKYIPSEAFKKHLQKTLEGNYIGVAAELLDQMINNEFDLSDEEKEMILEGYILSEDFRKVTQNPKKSSLKLEAEKREMTDSYIKKVFEEKMIDPDKTCAILTPLLKHRYFDPEEVKDEIMDFICKYVNTFKESYNLKRFKSFFETVIHVYEFGEEILEVFKFLRSDDEAIFIVLNNIAESLEKKSEFNFYEIGKKITEAALSCDNWYLKAVELNDLKCFKKYLSKKTSQLLKLLGQVDQKVLLNKIDDHFEQIDGESMSFEEKEDVLSIYAEFFKDFNDTFVPDIWYLYYLLKRPESATKHLKNLKYLNNIREVEHIATLEDLKEKMAEIKTNILFDNTGLQEYEDSNLTLAVLDDMAKVSASDWKRESRPLLEIIRQFSQDEEQVSATFNQRVYKSGFIPVSEVVGEFDRDPSLDKNISRVQDTIKSFVDQEGEFLEEKNVLAVIKQKLLLKLRENIEKTAQGLEKGESSDGEKLNPKAIKFMKKNLERSTAFVEEKVANTETLEELMHLLLSKQANSFDVGNELRSIFYYYGSKYQALNDHESWIYSSPDLIDASVLNEFLSDVILKDIALGRTEEIQIKLSKAERKSLSKKFKSLQNFLKQKNEEEAAFKDKMEKSTKNLAVIAGRGLLAELSGFYCDACWTSKENILKNNPTLVGHVMVENFEEKEKARIIGGCLTLESSIEVQDENGKFDHTAKVLIVRGLNPQDKHLKKYITKSFIESFLDYIQEAARKIGAEYVVLPLYNTGALSNRPPINKYLGSHYSKAKRVKLNDDIKFNGYKIKDSCVVVRDVSDNERQGKLPKPSNVPVDRLDEWIASW